MRDIRILPAVLQDVAEAAVWYDEDGYPGLGDRFLATFYSYLPEIEENGGIYRPVYLDFRKVIIRPFPYSIFYRLHDEVWIVTHVTHAARRPGRARRILRERKKIRTDQSTKSRLCGTSGILPAEQARMPEASRDT